MFFENEKKRLEEFFDLQQKQKQEQDKDKYINMDEFLENDPDKTIEIIDAVIVKRDLSRYQLTAVGNIPIVELRRDKSNTKKYMNNNKRCKIDRHRYLNVLIYDDLKNIKDTLSFDLFFTDDTFTSLQKVETSLEFNIVNKNNLIRINVDSISPDNIARTSDGNFVLVIKQFNKDIKYLPFIVSWYKREFKIKKRKKKQNNK